MPKRRFYKRDNKGRFARTHTSAGAKARKSQGGLPLVPHGKTLLLYHRTTPSRAKQILGGQRIFGGIITHKPGPSRTDQVFFSTRKAGQAKGYGSSILQMKVSRRKAHLDDAFPSGEEHFWVHPKDLEGIKIRRAYAPKRRVRNAR